MDWGFVALIELAVMVVQLLAFVGLYAVRSDWRLSPTGQAFLAFAATVTAAFIGIMLLAVAPVPGWIFALVFLAGNVIMTWLLRILLRAQRADRQGSSR
jgi:hypothetical protein